MTYFSEKNLLDLDPNSSKSDIQEGLKVTGNGKGDGIRPSQVNKQEYARNYCRTFGHKHVDPDTGVCSDCGVKVEHPKNCPHPRCQLPF
jgi:hypothetical protein